jgi:hypothetical protein
MFDKQDGQHLERWLLISKLRNLANDVSHDRSILTAKIFGATTTRQFLTLVFDCIKVMITNLTP